MGRQYPRIVITMVAVLVAAACGGPSPYVYDSDEFARDAPGFGKPPEDLDSVAICYATSGTTPQALRDLAGAECARFGKVAAFEGQDYLYCPLLTPTRARFACVRP